jgi:hypothetical protein
MRMSDKDLTMGSGTKRRRELKPAEKDRAGPVRAGSEELRRRIFNPVINAEKRENEALKMEGEAQVLPERISNLANRLSKTPFGKWTAEDMISAEKYFTPEQVQQIAELSERRNR